MAIVISRGGYERGDVGEKSGRDVSTGIHKLVENMNEFTKRIRMMSSNVAHLQDSFKMLAQLSGRVQAMFMMMVGLPRMMPSNVSHLFGPTFGGGGIGGRGFSHGIGYRSSYGGKSKEDSGKSWGQTKNEIADYFRKQADSFFQGSGKGLDPLGPPISLNQKYRDEDTEGPDYPPSSPTPPPSGPKPPVPTQPSKLVALPEEMIREFRNNIKDLATVDITTDQGKDDIKQLLNRLITIPKKYDLEASGLNKQEVQSYHNISNKAVQLSRVIADPQRKDDSAFVSAKQLKEPLKLLANDIAISHGTSLPPDIVSDYREQLDNARKHFAKMYPGMAKGMFSHALLDTAKYEELRGAKPGAFQGYGATYDKTIKRIVFLTESLGRLNKSNLSPEQKVGKLVSTFAHEGDHNAEGNADPNYGAKYSADRFKYEMQAFKAQHKAYFKFMNQLGKKGKSYLINDPQHKYGTSNFDEWWDKKGGEQATAQNVLKKYYTKHNRQIPDEYKHYLSDPIPSIDDDGPGKTSTWKSPSKWRPNETEDQYRDRQNLKAASFPKQEQSTWQRAGKDLSMFGRLISGQATFRNLRAYLNKDSGGSSFGKAALVGFQQSTKFLNNLAEVSNRLSMTFVGMTSIVGGLINSASPDAFQTLIGSVKILAATVGIELIPYAVRLSVWIQNLANAFSKLSPSTKAWFSAIFVWSTALIGGVVVFGKLWSAITSTVGIFIFFGKTLSAMFTTLGVSLGTLLGVVIPLGIALKMLYDYRNLPKTVQNQAQKDTLEANKELYKAPLEAYKESESKDIKAIMLEASGIADPKERSAFLEAKGKMYQDKSTAKQALYAESVEKGLSLEGKFDDSAMGLGLRYITWSQGMGWSNSYMENATMLRKAQAVDTRKAEYLLGGAKGLRERGYMPSGSFNPDAVALRDNFLMSLSSMRTTAQYSSIEDIYRKIQVESLNKDPIEKKLEELHQEGLLKMLESLKSIEGILTDEEIKTSEAMIGVSVP